MQDHPTYLELGKPLHQEFLKHHMGHGSSGSILLPDNMVIMHLADFRPDDVEVFHGPARFRVALLKSFIMISPAFRTFNFDIVWDPNVALRTGEPAMEDPKGLHPLYRFILVDGVGIIRGMRMATISPECAYAIYRAQSELREKPKDHSAVEREMMTLFQSYPRGFMDGFFHETCALGD